MNILITGGAGFIGNALVSELSKNKENCILVIDSLTEQIHGKNSENSYLYKGIQGKCDFIRGDVRDYHLVEQCIKKSDCVIHLAAETGTGQSMYQINQYNEVNIMGTSNIFQAISTTGVRLKKFILASSRSVYGEGKYSCPIHGTIYPSSRNIKDMQKKDFAVHCPFCNEKMKLVPTDEKSEIMPNSLYAFTKYAQEKMTETMCNALQIDYTIFRFQNVYGVGQSLKNPYTGILSIFSALLLENKDINIFEDGKESRDFVNVKDVVSAVSKSIFEPKTNGEIINLGSGTGTSVLDVAKILKEKYQSNSNIIITNDFRIGDIANNIADIQKAKKLLNFVPQYTLEEGLLDFSNWVQQQEIDNSGYEKSLNEMQNKGMLVRGHTNIGHR